MLLPIFPPFLMMKIKEINDEKNNFCSVADITELPPPAQCLSFFPSTIPPCWNGAGAKQTPLPVRPHSPQATAAHPDILTSSPARPGLHSLPLLALSPSVHEFNWLCIYVRPWLSFSAWTHEQCACAITGSWKWIPEKKKGGLREERGEDPWGRRKAIALTRSLISSPSI